ncbi:MAG: hypothetical protein AAB353_01030 [Candidatus Hydrogenedentota bacterium]
MDRMASIGGVGIVAGAASTRFSQAIQGAVASRTVAEDIGNAALKLIRAAIVLEPVVGRYLDVTA